MIMTDQSTTPPGRSSSTPAKVVPYLAVKGAVEALAFYARAFGAEEVMRLELDGKIGHAEFRIGGATFFLADEWEPMKVLSPLTLGGYSVSLAIVVTDADAFVQHLADCGATVERPVEDGPAEGQRAGWVIDPYGHRWHISAPTAAADR
jgi:PhnB protein